MPTATERKPNPFDLSLGRQVKRLRLQAGMSLSDLGRRIRITVGMVSHIESGRRTPSVQVLHALTRALHCSADELLGSAAGQSLQQCVCPQCMGMGVVLKEVCTAVAPVEGENADEGKEEEASAEAGGNG